MDLEFLSLPEKQYIVETGKMVCFKEKENLPFKYIHMRVSLRWENLKVMVL
jgi:hypothetical protein